MTEGEIQQVGDANHLYEHSGKRFVAEFLGDSNRFEGRTTGNGTVESNGRTLSVGESPPMDATVSVVVGPENMEIAPEHESLDVGNAWTGAVTDVI